MLGGVNLSLPDATVMAGQWQDRPYPAVAACRRWSASPGFGRPVARNATPGEELLAQLQRVDGLVTGGRRKLTEAWPLVEYVTAKPTAVPRQIPSTPKNENKEDTDQPDGNGFVAITRLALLAHDRFVQFCHIGQLG